MLSTARYTFVPQKAVTDKPLPVSKALEHEDPESGLMADVHVGNDELNLILPELSIATYASPFDEAEVGL